MMTTSLLLISDEYFLPGFRIPISHPYIALNTRELLLKIFPFNPESALASIPRVCKAWTQLDLHKFFSTALSNSDGAILRHGYYV